MDCTLSFLHIIRFTLDIGVPQTYVDEVDLQDFLEDYHAGVTHLLAVAKNPELRHVLQHCQNKHSLCTYWASRGDCDTNKYFMDMECCPVCQSASTLDWNLACPITEGAVNAWKPGDLHRFFTNLTRLEQYSLHVYSRPDYLPGDTNETAKYDIGPWVVTLENVVSPQEAHRLIQHGEAYGWEESLIAGDVKEDGSSDTVVSDYRTSQLAWCSRDSCLQDPIVQTVLERISTMVDLHSNHSDYFQLLKYEEGQYYEEHHDLHHYQIYSMGGARILTFYIYLSDVPEGGGTNFPYLNNLTITPKLGRALLWPNVLNEDPDTWDERMFHQALPVIRGQKYGGTAVSTVYKCGILVISTIV